MELFKIGFLTIHFKDVVDVLIVGYLVYRLWDFLKGTISSKVLIFIVLMFGFWKVVDYFGLGLLSTMLSQIWGLGSIAFVIVFAPEIRRMLTHFSRRFDIQRLFDFVVAGGIADKSDDLNVMVVDILEAVGQLREQQNGALIVLMSQDSQLDFVQTGEKLNADMSAALLVAIFQKTSPLHDGAVIIQDGKIAYARCILPITDAPGIDPKLATRHRAALGITEMSDAVALVVSEERGTVSLVHKGKIEEEQDMAGLKAKLYAALDLELPN